MSLKDFRHDISNFDSGEDNLKNSDSQVSALIHQEEINTLKIDKLSNRVTIISIIIPCIIGAILVFGYIDMKERVFDVDVTKQSQVDKISQQLEEKLNALDVKIAKNRFALENKLPEFEKKSILLEGQIGKLESAKADTQTINDQFKKIAKQISNNANLDKTTLNTIERINKQTLLTFNKNNDQFKTLAKQIKNETALLKKEAALFKKELNAQLNEFSDDDQQIGELRKDFSLMDKKFKNIDRESISKTMAEKRIAQMENDINSRMNNLDSLIGTLDQKLVANISRLQKDIDQLSNRSSKTKKPKTQIDIDSPKSVTIKEKPLTQ
jgi:chromosome segregation ATPase